MTLSDSPTAHFAGIGGEFDAWGMFDLFGGGNFGTDDRERLARIEAKLDLILEHLGVPRASEAEPRRSPACKGGWTASPDSLSEEVKQLLDTSRGTVEAIKLHRQQTHASLGEAKRAIDAYRAIR